MPDPTVTTHPPTVTAETTVGGLDAVTVVEGLDHGQRTVALRFHGVAGGVVLSGQFEQVYELILAADRELGRLYRPEAGGQR